MTSLTIASAALRSPTLGNKSSGDTPSVPVRGQVNPFLVNPSRIQLSQVGRPSVSHGTNMAFLTIPLQIPHSKCSGMVVAVNRKA